jgi:hypothetical protein
VKLIDSAARKGERLSFAATSTLPSSQTLMNWHRPDRPRLDARAHGHADVAYTNGTVREPYAGRPEVDVHFDVVKEPEVSDHRALLLDLG